MVTDDDPEITTTQRRSGWLLVLADEQPVQESYTPEGIAKFNAWAPLHQAVNTPGGRSEGDAG